MSMKSIIKKFILLAGVVDAMTAGMVSINSFGLALPEVPFGASRIPGYGDGLSERTTSHRRKPSSRRAAILVPATK
jgi:acyl-CoA reductase-like NAD-dependent aldehyde dehydrogenase